MAGDRRSDRNNGGEGPSSNRTGLSREDLMAIVTMVATTLQGLVGPNHNQAPPPPPSTRGTKFYYESLRKNKAPTFDGSHDPEVAQTWMKNIETQLRLLEVADDNGCHNAPRVGWSQPQPSSTSSPSNPWDEVLLRVPT
ncbi:hypothetical protein F511_17756 [Dorcoceras hygrometricum]|uniref:Uncharacterized protein n=1 Tax=Dorcoceras hygrometricum TaxID=472368 RepID=A0A2Z7BGP2_9LAMI|nr:hypothetical protein F511_17756 [Dorcoceras hygrometricum]